MSTRSLDFAIDRESVRASVLSVAKGGLKVRLPRTLAAIPGIGARLDAAALSGGVGPVRSLSALVVDAIDVDEHGAVATLDAADDGTRAGLWLELEVAARDARAGHAGPDGAMPRIPERGIHTDEARRRRLGFLHEQTGRSLASLEATTLAADRLTGNIENLIGSVEVPVASRGRSCSGARRPGRRLRALATTEGALVASVTRGALAITRCGRRDHRGDPPADDAGAAVRVRRHAERATASQLGARPRARIREQALRVSRHADLVQIEPSLRGNMVTVTFLYETGDAAGQNMTTSCTWHACQWLLKQIQYLDEIRLEDYFIESGLERRQEGQLPVLHLRPRHARHRRVPSAPEGGGGRAQGDARGPGPGGGAARPPSACRRAPWAGTSTSPTWWPRSSPPPGRTSPASTSRASAMLHVQPVDDGIYASIVLPSLVVGTVGGGTHLPRQKELLELIGCAGPGKVCAAWPRSSAGSAWRSTSPPWAPSPAASSPPLTSAWAGAGPCAGSRARTSTPAFFRPDRPRPRRRSGGRARGLRGGPAGHGEQHHHRADRAQDREADRPVPPAPALPRGRPAHAAPGADGQDQAAGRGGPAHGAPPGRDVRGAAGQLARAVPRPHRPGRLPRARAGDLPADRSPLRPARAGRATRPSATRRARPTCWSWSASTA